MRLKGHVYRFCLVTLLMIALGVGDSVFGMVVLKRAFLGISEDRYSFLFRMIGLAIRIAGLGGISFFAFRYYKSEKLSEFVTIFCLIGAGAGLWIFLIRGALMTEYVLAQKQLYLFNFFKLAHALILMVFSAFVCTGIGFLARMIASRRLSVQNGQADAHVRVVRDEHT